MDERDPKPVDDLATQGAPASPEALKEIVARHRRGRTRTLGALLAVALVAGPLAGWAIGNSGGGGQQLATGSQASTPEAGAPVMESRAGTAGAIAFPEKNPPKATHLFNRTTADGIAIRAYRMDPPQPATDASSTSSTEPKTQEAPCPASGKPGAVTGSATAVGNSGASASATAESGSSAGGEFTSPPPAPPVTVINGTPPPCPPPLPPCKATPSVLSELSTDAAVGQGSDAIDEKQPSDALSHVSFDVFGVAENAPAVFVTVQTGPGVANVRLRLPTGETDEMAPSQGIAVLAHGTSTPKPTGIVVEALDGNGKVIASNDVAQPGPPRPMVACGFVVGPNTVKAAPMPAPATPPTTR